VSVAFAFDTLARTVARRAQVVVSRNLFRRRRAAWRRARRPAATAGRRRAGAFARTDPAAGTTNVDDVDDDNVVGETAAA